MYGREHRAMRTAERERLGERRARRFREIDRDDNARELIHVVLPTGTACLRRSLLIRKQEGHQRGGWALTRNRFVYVIYGVLVRSNNARRRMAISL